MPKKVQIAAVPRGPKESKPAVDQWVKGAGDVRMKRFTIDVPEELHRRIKVTCASRGTNMADEIRAVLDKHFADNKTTKVS